MAVVTVRNIPDATHRAIKASAKRAGRSTEAQIRFTLEEAFRPPSELGLGDEIQAIMRKHMGQEWSDEGLVFNRDKTPAIQSAAVFE